jgi:hypothetical protein
MRMKRKGDILGFIKLLMLSLIKLSLVTYFTKPIWDEVKIYVVHISNVPKWDRWPKVALL